MIKTITVCDFCKEEKHLIRYDDFEACQTCSDIYFKAREDSRKEIQAKVDFTVHHREYLIAALKENDSVKYWGNQGLEIRKKLLESL